MKSRPKKPSLPPAEKPRKPIPFKKITSLPGHELLGEGRHRIVFRRGNVVVKIPKDSPETGWGLHDNWSESRTFQREHRKGVSEVDNEQMQFARCRILKNGWLVMIYAEPIPYDEQPDWAGLIDCGQVGRTSKGKIVAYDFALGEHREDHRFSCPALESAHSR